jgi:hypothetical protein
MHEAIEKALVAYQEHIAENPYDPDAPAIKAMIESAIDGRLIGIDGKDVAKGMRGQSDWNRQISNLTVASRVTRQAIQGMFKAFINNS